MKKFISMIISIVLLSSVCVYAAESENESVIEEFFRIAKVKEKYEKNMLAGFDAGSSMIDKSTMSEEKANKFEQFQIKIKNLMLEEMGWEKVKSDYTKLYLATYTETELKEITKLLKTPSGQLLVNKEIELMPKVIKIGQDKAKELMPKIMQLSMEMMKIEEEGVGEEEEIKNP